MGRIRHAAETWSEPWKLYAPLKPDTEAPFRFKDTLIIKEDRSLEKSLESKLKRKIYQLDLMGEHNTEDRIQNNNNN